MAVDVQDVAQRHNQLTQDQESWRPDWKECARHFLPRKCRILEQEGDVTNRGGLRMDLLDSTPIYAMRDLSAGLHGGMTSPARPWFRLGLQDEKLEKMSAVREWLDESQTRMRSLFHRSNFYNAIHTTYAEIGTFGTGFLFEVPDARTMVRFVPMTVGEYVLDIDESGRVDTVFREMMYTPRQLCQKFGYDKLPSFIQSQYDKPSTTVPRHRVVHAVYPRADRDYFKLDGVNKKWASVYYLDMSKTQGNFTQSKVLLSEGGFDEMPGFGPRWDVTGQDVYGRSPGMDVLPDARMLQQMTRTMLRAMHKEADPPMVSQGSLKHLDMLPGGENYVDGTTQGQSVYPALNLRPNVSSTMQGVAAVQNQIKEGLFNNLFRLLMNSDRRQITAKEVAAREEEKLILIGPVLERLHDELFIPLIDRTFNLMTAQDLLPPAPPEIQGMDIKVEFVSLLAQAQKMVSTASVDQFMGFISLHAQVFPELLDIPNADNIGDGYAEYLGVEANMLHSEDERKAKRDGRAKDMQAAKLAQTAQLADTAASAAQKLGATPVSTPSGEPNSALQTLLGGLGQNQSVAGPTPMPAAGR